MLYIEVILPVPLAGTFTYFVPPEMEAQIAKGKLVQVNFGKNKRYSGIIYSVTATPPDNLENIKPVLAVESAQPVIGPLQWRFWKWISTYYLCRSGETFKAALPPGFHSEKASAYSEKKETFVRLSSNCENNELWPNILDGLKRVARQKQLLLTFIKEAKPTTDTFKEISKKELLEKSQTTAVPLAALIEKGIFQTYEKTVSRLETYDKKLQTLHALTLLQQQAYDEIIRCFQQKEVCLLHGAASSGKTKIYTHLIHETLQSNKQVLYLLPEIALTAQITDRLKSFFGDRLGVYHSGIGSNERVEIWNNLLNSETRQIILGVRSSIFLPFRNLGLIIVDEEHDPSYKQHDPAPRYHARNAAVMLATQHGAKVVLGSATPSIESFYNAQTGKYGYVRLNNCLKNKKLIIIPVDVKELRRKKKMKGIFSPLLIERMQKYLEKNEQILLFQNRKGFALSLICRICDWTPKCRFCDISLTYHKNSNQLSCRYCGRYYHLPSQCPDCGNPDLKPVGFGTEKIEEEIKQLFPSVSVARIDADTAKTQQSFEKMISRFKKEKTQVLIGTQMISKGLDFENIGLAGILNVDALMNYPDFRSYERAYQLIMQVAGKAGRKENCGEVILQTSHPDHPLIEIILHRDYEEMYEKQLEERMLFRYPPFFRLIQITLRHKKEETLRDLANEYSRQLKEKLGERVIGPDKPAVGKVQNFYIKKILLKIELTASFSALREIIEPIRIQILKNPNFRGAIVQYDVDPM
jgi:primosomal protein N' (replication factor Y)